MRPERIGILGGTFDPIHTAHIVAAVASRHQLRLDTVMLVVAGDPWQKAGRVVASAAARFAMARAAVDGVEGLEASAIEVERAGATYTADTVAALARPDRELFLIVGSDAARGLESWQRVDEVRASVTLAVVSRAGEERIEVDDRWRLVSVAIPRLDISSTDVRARVAHGAPIDGLVPPGAIRVLRELDLYTPP